MADVFISYAKADHDRAAALAAGLEADGRSLWWDRRLAAGRDYNQVIEREIAAASSVVIAWSGTARDSLWVRAEACEALDQGKLVQINLDDGRLPSPFAMRHCIDFARWSGARDQAPWPELRSRVDAASSHGTEAQAGGRRPDRGGVPVWGGAESPLQGFGRVATLGWAALAVAAVLALSVLAVARRLISADAFGVIAAAAAVVAAALLAASAYMLLRSMRGGRP